jgi:photosystem II stability/assembly factor-like uncharacterized protein
MFSKKGFLVRLHIMAIASFLAMGVWQSTSYAAWTQITIPGTTGITYVAVADSILFASANEDSMVFRSTDNGTTWQKVTGIRGFTKIKGNNSKLFAIEAFYSYGYLFSSSDRGISWSKVTTIDSAFNSGVCDLSVQDNKILTILNNRPLLSINNGQSWAILNSSGWYSQFQTSCYIKGNILFLGGKGGVYSSSNLGHTWYESNYGIYGLFQNEIIKIVSTGNFLYAIGNDVKTCVYCSKDSGSTWKSMDFKRGVYDISFSKTTAFIGTNVGVYAAPLDSAKWTDISMLPNSYVFSLATDTGYLYAATRYDDTILKNSTYSLYRRPLSEVNALLKQQVSVPQPIVSNNFVIDHFASQHALGITFNPGRTEKASLKVYSATGKAVTTLFDGTTQYGINKFIWDYKTIPSGIYCISLQSENGKAVKKVQVTR